MFNIKVIDQSSPHLATVKKLWRVNSATLGFFTDGAFQSYAYQRTIMGAIDVENECRGYVIYRISHGAATIVHLCVDKGFRGKGIAFQLFEALKEATKTYYGIAVKCRRDYDANGLWPKFGFIPQYDVLGRGADRKELTYWWLDNGHPSLFSPSSLLDSNKLPVVIDTNVFIDFQRDSQEAEDSKALLADWLQGQIDLCITDETYIEINRSNDSELRKNRQILADSFVCVNHDLELFKATRKSLLSMFPHKLTHQDKSDLAQIAKTISSRMSYFITRDEELLRKHDEIHAEFGLSIIHPSDLITKIDEYCREAEYSPARLIGTSLILRRMREGELDNIVEVFQCPEKGETQAEFKRKIRWFLASPQRFNCKIILDQEIPRTLVVQDISDAHTSIITMLRIDKSTLSPTIVRNIILGSIKEAAEVGQEVTEVADCCMDDRVIKALKENGFIQGKEGFVKINLMMHGTADEIAKRIETINIPSLDEQSLKKIESILRSTKNANNNSTVSEVERFLWPAKITNVNLPCFIIPIKPMWAEYLFDEELARQNLFGVDSELALQNESVYYRSKRNSGGLSAPARILWYESFDNKYHGSKHIRACSMINEVVLGKPKDLYRRFKRLGVYEWKQVAKIVNNNHESDIMAIRFSHTELFKNPIPWEELQRILRENSITSNLQSPLPVSEKVFFHLFEIGNMKYVVKR